MSKRLSLGLSAIALSVAGYYLFTLPSPRSGGEVAATPHKFGPDPFGYSHAFDVEIRKLGPISTNQFAERYPPPAYLPKLTWDPVTAKFFDVLNADKIQKSGNRYYDEEGKTFTQLPATEVPGFKLGGDELTKYKTNGFVVSERLGGRSFGEVYYAVYSRNLPVFITSDSILHAWHRSYDNMLEELERTYFMHSLADILAAMHAVLPKVKEAYGEGVLVESLLDADYFLAVARNLLAMNGRVGTHFNQDDRVCHTLTAVEREGLHDFKLFGRDRTMDFSQFKPRGHYEAIPELRYYFKAMMWCGRTDLRIAGGYDGTGPLSAPRELGSALVLLDLLRNADKMTAWRNFDAVIQTFVGRTDSATFDDLAKVSASMASINDLKTEADLQKITDAVLASDTGKQDIRGDVYLSPHPRVKVSLPRSFTFLGQKFVVDSWVTSKTVYDDIMLDGSKVIRRVPSGLDVAFAAFGNNHVTPALVERIDHGEHQFRDRKPYQHNLAAVRNVTDSMQPEAWNETIYTAWLKTLRTLNEPAGAAMPEAMRTREWAMKQTNTQLASWSQLRHDTILYVKQSYTAHASCYYPAGFVEPVVPFWAQMEAMARRSADLLEQAPFPQAMQATQLKQVKFHRAFSAQMAKLKAVAEKQLQQKDLTAEETKVLEDVMQIGHQRAGSGSNPKFTGWYPALFYRGPEDSVKWDALVADVHTDVPCDIHGDPGCVLHQGVGNVDLMIIAIDNGKDRVAYCGPTLSHYEFEMTGTVRKTDREWKTDLLDGKAPPRPEWTRGYLVPLANRTPATPQQRQQLLD